jgi:hypothetical protein
MATIELSEREIALLCEMLERNVSELHEEIYHTDNFELRQELKAKKEELKELMKRLGYGRKGT